MKIDLNIASFYIPNNVYTMNPVLSKPSDENDIYRFTLSGINVSFANSIRRTILSDIPITVIQTEPYEQNQCEILTNTGRLHNEIIKQRLSCIPIQYKILQDSDDGEALPDKYQLEVNVTNTTDNMLYVTTEDFRIRNKSTGVYMPKEKVREIFPPHPKTGYYIDFARLRPMMGDGIPAEQLHLTANFSLGTAKQSSMFNVVSKCSYGNTPDHVKATEVWDEQEVKLKSEGATQEDITFQKRNFELLDAQRHFIDDSFDFVIQTIGIYDNRELVRKACAILQNKFIDIIQDLDNDTVDIHPSETTMNNCYDVILQNEDYTIGKVLEYIIYEKYYMEEKSLNFCGFKKFHPHNADATLRLAFTKKGDKSLIKEYLRDACLTSADLFKKIYGMF